jgi:hypothetical protein
MTEVKFPESDASNRELDRFAVDLKRPTADYIDTVTGIFRQAKEIYSEEDLDLIEYAQLESDHQYTYNNQRGFVASDKFQIQPMLTRERESRGRPVADKNDAILKDPLMQKYAFFRSNASSGLRLAIDNWYEINHPGKISFLHVQEWEMDSEPQYFHDVNVGDLGGHMPLEAVFPGDLVVLPTFENEKNGELLMQATIRVIQQLGALAAKPDVQSALAAIPEVPKVARLKDTYEGVDEDTMVRNTGTRQLIEATLTASQSATSLLSGLRKEYDMHEAMTSLERNGVFRLFRLVTRGTIGPLTVNGTRLNPEYVLDQEMLKDGEFALRNKLSDNIIKSYQERKRRRLISDVSSSEDYKQHLMEKRSLVALGCPAKPDVINFVSGLLVEELKKQKN